MVGSVEPSVGAAGDQHLLLTLSNRLHDDRCSVPVEERRLCEEKGVVARQPGWAVVSLALRRVGCRDSRWCAAGSRHAEDAGASREEDGVLFPPTRAVDSPGTAGCAWDFRDDRRWSTAGGYFLDLVVGPEANPCS